MNYTEKLLLTLLLISLGACTGSKDKDVVSDASTSTDSDNQDTSSGGNSSSLPDQAGGGSSSSGSSGSSGGGGSSSSNTVYTGLDFFGDINDFKFTYDTSLTCGGDDYTYIGNGAVTYNSGYKVDLNNTNRSDADQHALFFSEAEDCLIAASSDTSNSAFQYWRVYTGLSSVSDVIEGASVTAGSILVTSSNFSGATFTIGSTKYFSDNEFVWLGSNSYLEMTNTGSSLDNFLTKAADWAIGFTVKEDWHSWGGVQQLFVDQTTSGNIGNFGFGAYMIGSSFYGIYGRSYSGGVTYTSISGFTSSDLPSSGDSVIVRYESSGNALRVYVNGSEVFNTTGSFNATAASNRSFTFGKPKTTQNSLWGEVYHGEKCQQAGL